MVGCLLWGQSTDGKCRLGYVIGFAPSSLIGPRHVLQWTSNFTRKPAKSNLGGGAYASGEVAGHLSVLREIYAPFEGVDLGNVRLEDGESLFTHLKTKKMITAKYLTRHSLSIQLALGEGTWITRIGYRAWRIRRMA